jgi:hypothetical protein
MPSWALLRWLLSGDAEQIGAVIGSGSGSSAPGGYRFPREVIAVAVRWYLRNGLLATAQISPCSPRPRTGLDTHVNAYDGLSD